MSATSFETPRYAAAEEVETLVRGFESCTLAWAEWTHAAHLTVALWYALRHDPGEALRRVREGIKRYNLANGVVTTRERGYHETITRFWMRHVRDFLDSRRGEGWPLERLANELVACAKRDAPLEHYSRELLFSWEARAGYVEPDLKPFAPSSSDAGA